MRFYDYLKEYKNIDFDKHFENVTDEDVLKAINKEKLTKLDLLTLLSSKASKYLELLAQRANKLTTQYFGRTILLYTPMYLSNYCVNTCAYCGYNIKNKIKRKTLTLEEIEIEAKAIASTGLKHILILTGESSKEAPVEYIIDAVKILKKYFDSITIEIYPLDEEDYKRVVDAGVDGLTVYQEVYDEEVYDRVHIAGPKKNYKYRLDAPERACIANIRTVTIGALLGLTDFRKEAFYTALHADYIQNKYPNVEVSVSVPRIRPHKGNFEDVIPVDDKILLQIMLVWRIFLPYVGINISTRESQRVRNALIPLGITKMSAGVSTEVGGHSQEESAGESQFEIDDNRSVEEMKKAILSKNYQPILKNWTNI